MGELIRPVAQFEHLSLFFSLAGKMEIRWLAVLCTWALLAQFSLAFPEEELLDEFELGESEPGGKTLIFSKTNFATKTLLDLFSKTTDLDEIK